jgi:protein-S-isoprenylcysteine O-methyltransferase Ste14
VLLAAWAIGILVLASPTKSSVAVGLLVSLTGLTARLWTISWIGPAARTNLTDAPDLRIVAGPYRLRHPLYLANTLVGVGFVWACRPSLTVFTIGVVALFAFYGALAGREDLLLKNAEVPNGVRPRLTLGSSFRAERSTLATAAGAFGLLVAWVVLS